MISDPPPFKGLTIRIHTVIPIKPRGFINQGSGLAMGNVWFRAMVLIAYPQWNASHPSAQASRKGKSHSHREVGCLGHHRLSPLRHHSCIWCLVMSQIYEIPTVTGIVRILVSILVTARIVEDADGGRRGHDPRNCHCFWRCRSQNTNSHRDGEYLANCREKTIYNTGREEMYVA